MTTRSLSDEAKYCRELANDFEGSEKPFLIAVANAFEELASATGAKTPRRLETLDT